MSDNSNNKENSGSNAKEQPKEIKVSGEINVSNKSGTEMNTKHIFGTPIQVGINWDTFPLKEININLKDNDCINRYVNIESQKVKNADIHSIFRNLRFAAVLYIVIVVGICMFLMTFGEGMGDSGYHHCRLCLDMEAVSYLILSAVLVGGASAVYCTYRNNMYKVIIALTGSQCSGYPSQVSGRYNSLRHLHGWIILLCCMLYLLVLVGVFCK